MGEVRALLLTRKPQAMLVDEKSTSVETVKKEPPFATIEAGNANRTKAKGGSSIWTKKVYHIRVGIAISHSTGAKVSQKGNLREIKKRYWKNPENAL